MITGVRDALVRLGYKVHHTRQEKIGYDELLVIIDDVEVIVESTHTYFCKVFIIIEWDTMDGDGIPNQIVSLVDRLEEEIVHNSDESARATFTFVGCDVNPLGLIYRVTATLRYTEVIDLG